MTAAVHGLAHSADVHNSQARQGQAEARSQVLQSGLPVLVSGTLVLGLSSATTRPVSWELEGH